MLVVHVTKDGSHNHAMTNYINLILPFICMFVLGCGIIRICGITMTNYCLESITINRLIGDLELRCSAANKTILLYYKC